MANTAAYSGLRWGELTALTIQQVDQAGRVITVDRKVVEVAGHLFLEAPKNRKFRRTIYPRRTPAGYPLAERLATRIEQARAEQEAGTNPLGLIFPSPRGNYWRSSNFNRNVLQRAYLAAGWRGSSGGHEWTWHSLRHVFSEAIELAANSLSVRASLPGQTNEVRSAPACRHRRRIPGRGRHRRLSQVHVSKPDAQVGHGRGAPPAQRPGLVSSQAGQRLRHGTGTRGRAMAYGGSGDDKMTARQEDAHITPNRGG
jgi:hypothetical protein